jgi:uncharacterized protein (TIGR00730 family)
MVFGPSGSISSIARWDAAEREIASFGFGLVRMTSTTSSSPRPGHAITVFCSARETIDRVYFDAADALGRAIASNGWSLVYGGNNCGLMRAVATGCRGAGGKVVGITPQLMVDQDIHDTLCDELVVTACMRTRKQQLEARGDAFVILPGGLGTFEELFEIIVGRQLGYHDKPIVFLNTADYYAPLLAMIEHGIDGGFIRGKCRELYHVSANVADAVAYLRNSFPTNVLVGQSANG